MNSLNYEVTEAQGKVPIEKIIDHKYLAKAKEYEQLMKDLTLSGNIKINNRTEEEIQKDRKAIELLNKIAKCENPALAYGFMLYNETGITKIYWTKRVGKLRKNKSEFFGLDKYLEWLTEIFATLNGDHSKFHDPLYYFKPNGKNKKGEIVGNYDVMNSFRTHWNMYFLPILAIYLFNEDKKQNDYGVSIDSIMESETGASNHLEAEISKKCNSLSSPDVDMDFKEVESFLKAFNKFPLKDPIAFKAGTKATGISYKDIMIALVDGSLKNPTSLRSKFSIGLSIQEKIMNKIKRIMDKYGVTIQNLADYISEYRTVAMDILNGRNVTFNQELI